MLVTSARSLSCGTYDGSANSVMLAY